MTRTISLPGTDPRNPHDARRTSRAAGEEDAGGGVGPRRGGRRGQRRWIAPSGAWRLLGSVPSCLALLLVACGGGGPQRPKPLSTQFDESYLDTVPYERKEVMFRAQNQYQRARAKFREAESKLAEAKTMLQVAKNERQQAILDEKSAAEKSKQAESTGDMNRVNAAAREARIAELARRAADEKVEARKAEVAYLEKLVLYAEEEMYHQEARFEQTKAKLARDNNIQPKGFEYAPYQKQVDERSKRAQRAKLIADQELQKANDKKKKWEEARKQLDAARGIPTPASTGASDFGDTQPSAGDGGGD